MRLLLPTVAVLAAAASIATHAAAPDSGPDRGRMELVASVKHAVSVTSPRVTGLYPRASKLLTLRIRNTYAYPVRIASLRTTLAPATTRRGCAGTRTNLLVSRRAGAIAISPKKSATVVMTVVMPSTVANACQGATFRITFTAHAVRG